MRFFKVSTLLFCGLVFLIGCQKFLPSAPDSENVLAEPVEGLSADQMALHLAGDGEFARVFSTIDGLGPVFVQASCENCHVGDGKGNPFNNLTRFGKYDSAGIWDPLLAMGGPQLQHRALAGYAPEELPSGVRSSQFVAPNVTGLGYLAAVEDAEILSRLDSLDSDGNGISGTVNLINPPEWLVPDPRYHDLQAGGRYIGRFGRKAAAIDLKQQTVGAYKQDMGITSDFDLEDPVNLLLSPFADDGVADPEIPASTVNKIVFYLQSLKAPPRRNESSVEVMSGEQLFIQVGCENCHTATLRTGPSEISALNNVEFHPYTDMLMHDMGEALNDGYTEGIAETSEWRTMPLWGIGLQQDSQGGLIYLLHDGRATTFNEAILLHGGESANSREAYNQLSESDKEKLIKFLESL